MLAPQNIEVLNGKFEKTRKYSNSPKMKLILSILLICLSVFSFGQTTFPWNGTYGGTGTNRTYSTTVSGITMSATIVNSENTWQDASPVWFPSGSSVAGGGCSGIAATNQGMLLSTDWTTNPTKTITTTITFSSPVQGPVNFKLYDVNDDGFGSWEDKIQISGTNSSAAAVNVFKVGTACVQTGGSVTGNGSTLLTFNSGQSTSCTCWGNNEINVGTATDCISTVTITYKSNVSPTNYNNPKQYVVISNLTAIIPVATPPTSISGTTSICAGQSTTLTAVGGNASTQWFTGSCGGTLVGTGTTLTVSPGSTTTYYVRNGATACIPVSSCIPVTVTVNPAPTMTSGTSATICSGSAVNFPLTSDFGTSYSWIATNNANTTGESTSAQTSSTINNTLVNTSTVAQTVLYTVTPSASGCAGTPQTVSVLVNPAPTVNAGPDISICAGTSTTLTASGATTYSWAPGGQTTASITVNPASTTTYTVTGTSAGCTATDAVVVSISSGASINAGPDVTICPGNSTTLTASGGVTYSWNNGLGTGNNFSVSPASTTTYSVTGTDAGGCTGTDNITVSIASLPTVNAGPDQTICSGSLVTLNGSGASTYSWNNGVTNGVAFTPATTTTYTVIGTSVQGCTNTDQVTITVNSGITVNAGLDVTICSGTSTTLTASGATTYSWTPGGLTTASITVNPAATTTYTVTGTSAGCTATDAVTVTITSGAPINAGPDVSICTGGSAILAATGGVSYSWNNGLGSGNNFSVSPASTTTYTVTGIDAGGCVGTDNLVVTVNPLPTLNAGLDQTICTGTSITLIGNGASTYSWDNGVSNGTAFTPSATTTYTLTGTSTFGCIATDQVTISVSAPLVVNAGPDISICTGTSTTLTASGATNYSWSPGGQTTASITINPSATTTYTVTGTSAGCTSTDDVTVTITSGAPINAGTDVNICAGASTILIATGGVTYTWDNGLGTGNNFSISPSTTTTYTVTGTDAGGCVGTDNLVVTVNPLPSVNAGLDQTICTGTSITLTGSGASTYSWDNGVIDGIAFTPSATTTYTLTGTSVQGCTNTDQVTITLSAPPTITAGPDVTICPGTSATLTASGATTYSWTPGSQTTASITVNPSATTTYTVSGTDANGCTNSDQVQVTLAPLPTINAGPDASICTGSSTTLSATGGTSYTWNNGVTNGVAFSPSVTTTYTVTGTSAAGCTNTDNVTITVNTSSPVTFTASSATGCVPQTITLTNTTPNAANCVWTLSDGTILTGCSSVQVDFTQAGCYDVSLTTTLLNGCQGTLNQTNFICIDPLPDAAFTQSTYTITDLENTILFNNLSSGASSYNWYFGDGTPMSQVIDPIHTYNFVENGTYQVMLVAFSPAGCSDTAYSSFQYAEELVFWVPNSFTPDGNEYNQVFLPIFSSGYDPYNYNLSIYNRWGELIFETNDMTIGWDGTYVSSGKIHESQDDVYTWKIRYKVKSNDEHKIAVGHVTIIK